MRRPVSRGRVVQGAEAGLDPRLERTERVIGQPVVVLDEIHAGPGERRGQRGELGRPQSHGLERGGEQRPAGDARERPQPGDARARTGQPVERRERQLHVGEHHVGLERGVAVEDVQQLRRIAGGGGERLGDRHPMGALAGRVDALDVPQHVRGDPGVAGGHGPRQLDRLLEQERLGAGGDIAVRGPDEIGHSQRIVAFLGHPCSSA